ncbi:MAG: dTMP kinase, partial [Neisseriaceae bacterium]
LITDLTLLFDTKLDIAIARINKSRNKDRIEKENKLFFTKVQKAYYDILEEEPNRMKLIMTDQDIEQTRDTIISHLDNLIDAS